MAAPGLQEQRALSEVASWERVFFTGALFAGVFLELAVFLAPSFLGAAFFAATFLGAAFFFAAAFFGACFFGRDFAGTGFLLVATRGAPSCGPETAP